MHGTNHGAHDLVDDSGVGIQQLLERIALETDQIGLADRSQRGGMLLSVQEAHFSCQVAGPQYMQHYPLALRGLAGHRQIAFRNHMQIVVDIPLPEQDFSVPESAVHEMLAEQVTRFIRQFIRQGRFA
jgi:hypothetical protein